MYMSADWNDPKDVAVKHYKFLAEGDFEGWKETLMPDLKKSLESHIRGTTGEYWWEAGRKRVEQHGIRYEFQREETRYVSPDSKKYFFVRIKTDGEQMGYPLPVTLKK
jgi:hypothetical protein